MMTKHFQQTFFSKISECFQTLHKCFLHCTLRSDERLTLLQIHLVQKSATEENLCVWVLLGFFFLILCFLFIFLENNANLIYGNKWEISIEKFWDLQWTERESAHGYHSPSETWRILKSLLKDRAFSAVLLLLFVSELLSCYSGERDGQKGQQRPWKHPASIWNLNWGVVKAYFLFEDWKRRPGP